MREDVMKNEAFALMRRAEELVEHLAQLRVEMAEFRHRWHAEGNALADDED